MPEIKVYFADGTVEIFHEDQTFTAITFYQSNGVTPIHMNPSLSDNYSLWSHHHNGLFPSFLELLANSKYFFDIEKPDIYYNSGSVVKIESL
ncbi:hypothetical protein P7D52_10415 [Enterococcus dongliensis]|uniref:hypothetical protein n=1 Tax=Enterococcus dongliensis TaxID=2559925 RepID=UPI00288C785B|nr:hypothetical protein [Enterococcus dongliensis]MDT2643199.1 hypothetical protein [Enterococcus dongliensis]